MAQGSAYPVYITDASGRETEGNNLQFTDSTNQPVPVQNPITSGTLPQLSAWSSGTAQQNPVSRPITVVISPTGDNTNNAATVAIALSPDNSTFTTVSTWSLASAVNNTGAITTTTCIPLPDGWWIKLTLSHSTVAQSSYY